MKSRWISFLLVLFLAGCAPSPATPTELAAMPSLIPPTETPTASPLPPTETAIPSPTPFPGAQVLQLDSLATGVPWLPLEKTARPGVHFVGFNTTKPPFNNAMIRQAFAYAIDREVIAAMALKYKYSNAQAATTLTPPNTLGWNLYSKVGTPFNAEKARELFAKAGYSNPAGFPDITIVVSSYGDTAPGARFNMATAMAGMWKDVLGVNVNVEAIPGRGYGSRLRSDLPSMFWFGWSADINDPDNFMREIFHSSSQYNYGGFSNSEYDRLATRASLNRNTAKRLELYIMAERLLCETEAALIPLYHTR